MSALFASHTAPQEQAPALAAGRMNVDVSDVLTENLCVTCTPPVQRLKEYVEVNIGALDLDIVPLFAPRGTDQSTLAFIAEFCVLGLAAASHGEGGVARVKNLFVAYCIAKGMQGMQLVPRFARLFGEHRFAPGVPDAIKYVCQRCGIDPQHYPALAEIVRKLQLLWDAFEHTAPPVITLQWNTK